MVEIGLAQASYSFECPARMFGKTLVDIALRAESCGFASLLLADHLMQYERVGPPSEPVLESWTTLGYLASHTKTIGLGTLVSNNSLRNPGHLAKIGATLDILSCGRLVLGIGSGSLLLEHNAYGVPRHTAEERARRLEEAVLLIHRLWTEESVTFHGEYYSVRGAVCNPKPVQKPRPRIMVGGNSTRTLTVAAQYADACNLVGSPGIIKERLSVLDRLCARFGKNPQKFLRTTRVNVIIDRSEQDAKRKALRFKPRVMPMKRFLLNTIVGNPEQVAEGLKQLVDMGVTSIFIAMPDAHEPGAIELVGNRVIPHLN